MQPIAILTNQILKHPTSLKLNKRHVRWCRDRLQRAHRLPRPLASLGAERPRAFWTAKVGDAYRHFQSVFTFQRKMGRIGLTSRRGYSCASEGYEVLAASDQRCEDRGFLVDCIDSFNALFFCDFGCLGGHCYEL
jgi:hypothetical protein